jgi:hypothetical protein
MTEQQMPPGPTLMRLVNGFRVSQAIHVVASLGVADLLAEGPRTSDDIAAATATQPDAMYRLLRALAAENVFEEHHDRVFALTPLGELLRTDRPDSLAPWAVFVGGKSQWEGWENLEYSVRTGQSGTEKALGMSSWEYRAKNPDVTAIFDRAMTSISRTSAAAVVEAYDFSRFNTVADIAGGHGALLAVILSRFPAVRGVLFDQPHVVAGADELLRAAGVADRIEVVGGSFFEEVPAADAYVLQHIIHDWDDAASVEIVRTIRKSAPDGARLLVIERLLGPPNQTAEAKFSDLNMLVALGGGRERTVEEFDVILSAGGFRFVAAHQARTQHIVEAVTD